MIPEQPMELIPVETLLEKVRAMREQNYRLVQIGATRLPDQIEMTYSFDLESRLTSLRLHLPVNAADGTSAHLPSISSVYWGAFLYENEIHDLFNVQVDGMVVDFNGNFYRTTVKFPFGSITPPTARPAPAPAPEKVPAQ